MGECIRCGLCCKTYPIDVVRNDIIKWEEKGRKDILKEVSFINNYPKKGYGGFYIERTLRKPKQPCPFLIDNLCSIYDVRPMVCSDFPKSHVECVCPEFDSLKGDYWDRKKITDRQMREMRKSLRHFNSLMAILVSVRH